MFAMPARTCVRVSLLHGVHAHRADAPSAERQGDDTSWVHDGGRRMRVVLGRGAVGWCRCAAAAGVIVGMSVIVDIGWMRGARAVRVPESFVSDGPAKCQRTEALQGVC